jgi:hypothetical protein
MRPHEAVGMEREARPSDCPSEVEHEEEPIAVVAEKHRLRDRVGGDVEEPRRQVGTADAGHGWTLEAQANRQHQPSHVLHTFDTATRATTSVRHSSWLERTSR